MIRRLPLMPLVARRWGRRRRLRPWWLGKVYGSLYRVHRIVGGHTFAIRRETFVGWEDAQSDARRGAVAVFVGASLRIAAIAELAN